MSSHSKDNFTCKQVKCKNSVCACTPDCKCINCTCASSPKVTCKSNSKECIKSNGIPKNREGVSFTELLKTPNANVKYTVHSSEDRNGLPDIELSVCKEGSAASLGSAATPVNCAKTKECLSSCAGRVAVSAKNADAKATPSELADIAKLIKEHERDNEEIKKQKETGKSSGNQRPVSTESTLQSQQQKWKKKSKDQKPKSGDKSGKKSPASTDVAKK